jgi:hypothetical protein
LPLGPEAHLLRDGKKWLATGWYNDDCEKVAGEGKFELRAYE